MSIAEDACHIKRLRANVETSDYHSHAHQAHMQLS